jgi:glycine rich protein/type IX secretion system substrate protein/PKD domain-containing protein
MIMKKLLQLTLVLTLFSFSSTVSSQTTFAYTGSVQYFVVPSCVDTVLVDVIGAEGGGTTGFQSCDATQFAGGKGGRVQAKVPVTSGDTLFLYVGGMGTDNYANQAGITAGGWNGGGDGFNTTQYTYYGGAGGGGASDIRLNGTTLNDRIAVAGAGGGSGTDGCVCSPHFSYGGDGGGLTGGDGGLGNGCTQIAGKGGTPSAGGLAAVGSWTGTATDGALGVGGIGNNTSLGGGAGGGGYYGGGGGGTGSGGGGSSYTFANAANVVHTQGFQAGDGLIVITAANGINLTATIAPNDTVCEGTMVTLTGAGADVHTWNNGVTDGVPFAATVTTTYTMTGTDTMNACSDSIQVTLYVLPTPDATFTSTNTGLDYNYTNTEAGGVSWDWDFGDGDTAMTQNPNHMFPAEGQYVVCLTVVDTNGCSSTECDTLDASFPTGISETNSVYAIDLYPNPASDKLNINIPGLNEASQVEVYSILGRKVITEIKETSNTFSIDVSQLGVGNYFIKVISAKGVSMKRFTIER